MDMNGSQPATSLQRSGSGWRSRSSNGTRIVGSLTRSGSAWRSSSTKDMFSRSAHHHQQEDDEQALTWAAIEKLPTYDRVRTGILTGASGIASQIPVHSLGPQDTKNLMDRLLRVADQDNEKFLFKLKDRLDCVGIENPTIEVRFEHLDVRSEVYVGDRGVPTVLNIFRNKIEDLQGLVKPHCFWLCLGKLDSNLKVSGRITYNGHGMDEFVPQRTSAYISQHDVHIGEMTVRETLAFSAKCQRSRDFDTATSLEGQETVVTELHSQDSGTGYLCRYDDRGCNAEEEFLEDKRRELQQVTSRKIRSSTGLHEKNHTVFISAKGIPRRISVIIPHRSNTKDELQTPFDRAKEPSCCFSNIESNGFHGLFSVVAASRERYGAFISTFGCFLQLIVIVLGGFVMSRHNIKKWWIWGYWSSPLMYAQNAIAVNEFLGKSWKQGDNSNSLGVQVLESRGLFPHAKWFWIGVIALLADIMIFNVLFTAALTCLKRGCVENTKKKNVVLPFTPFSIAFSDIKYSVDMPQEMKAQGVKENQLVLLNGVNGAFRPGVLTALMGVSGAGKTTLMDVLAGRKTGGLIEGNIYISGYPKKQETFARISGYCEQTDIHSPHMTVYESLVYSAWLRLPAEIKSGTRKMFIEEVMEVVELTQLKKALVGLPGVSGLSTEQRKRLTIAVELVANPSIIFMDEPTSGLDARAAAIVMRTVRNTVNTGRTVVCTIHQPSIDIFEAFDELFLMKRGGEEIYVGPLGHNSCELIKGIKGVDKIKDGYNPATWILEVTTLAQEDELGISFSEIYKIPISFGMRNKALIGELSEPPPGSKDLFFSTKYSQPFHIQFMACFWKQFKSYWRNPSYRHAIRVFFTAVIGLMFGSIFWRLGSKGEHSRIYSMQWALCTLLFCSLEYKTLKWCNLLWTLKEQCFTEKAAGMYSALPFAYAQVAIEIPYTLFQTLLYGILVYSMINLEWTLIKFMWYLFFMFFTFLYFTYYGMMAVSMTPNSDIAAILSSAFYAIWNLFAGFIIPHPRLPVWWKWYFWASPVSWTLYGLFASQFGDKKDLMDTGETVEEFLRRYLGYKHEFLPVVAAAVVGFAFFFAFIFCILQSKC
ncbi:hypothetical protein J5N97_000670 [Dioscorea zingiberensis]|uniref:ABC transporter domain-containing protein n=1 Tax=Dioscorea zingiberensis TaxID=325984 RepID=A0A9D5BRY3_9LILI|nr:hypothetical protein J5N97_000670 [Dioscorea zingiberensis]